MLKKLQVRRKMLWKLLQTGQTCHNARMQKNALEHATTHTTTRARGILGQAHLTTLLASKIRLALLVVTSVKLHLTAYLCHRLSFVRHL